MTFGLTELFSMLSSTILLVSIAPAVNAFNKTPPEAAPATMPRTFRLFIDSAFVEDSLDIRLDIEMSKNSNIKIYLKDLWLREFGRPNYNDSGWLTFSTEGSRMDLMKADFSIGVSTRIG